MSTVSLAFKNMMRHRRRAILTAAILAAAISYYIIIDGMLKGFEAESIKNFIRLTSGDLKITSKDFNPDNFQGRIDDPNAVENVLRSSEFVVAFTERLKTMGFLDNGIDQYPVIIVGIDPQKDSTVFDLFKYSDAPMTSGTVLVGKNIASAFGVESGKPLFLNFQGDGGVRVSVERSVIKVAPPDPSISNSFVFMDINEMRELGNFGNSTTEIAVRTIDYRRADHFKKVLAPKLSSFRVLSWRDEGADFLTISQVKQKAQGVFLFFIVLIGIIGTANTVLISVYEKVREIGTLKALGMTDSEALRLFVLEGVLIGLIGSIVGVALGAFGNWYFVAHGINLTKLFGNMEYGYRVMGTVHSVWSVKSLIMGLIIGPLATGFAAMFPARTASRMTPAECLRWS